MNQVEIVEDYEKGTPSPIIAKKHGVSTHVVLRILRSAGVEIRSKGGTKKIYDKGWTQTFVDAYLSGESIQSIAKRMQVGFGTVQRGLNSVGVKKRPNGLRSRTLKSLPSDPGIIGYFAGLLDGEGNIQFKPYKDRINYKLAIYNTHHGVMQWLTENIGGSVRWDHKRTKRNGWKPCGIWSLYRAQDLYAIVQWCYSYLIVKKDTVTTLIDLLRAKGL